MGVACKPIGTHIPVKRLTSTRARVLRLRERYAAATDPKLREMIAAQLRAFDRTFDG